MKRIYLVTARKRLKLTQEQLEAKARVPQSIISRLETSLRPRVAFETVAKLAEALDEDPRALRFGPDPRAEQASV